MWKVTKEQYEEVKDDEGRSWYDKEIPLGENSRVSIRTITNNSILSNITCPSDAYIKTIALGLKDTSNFNDEEIVDYLIEKKGISGSQQKDAVLKIIVCL